ncbi:MAG TPA: hypothetical protein VKH81_06700 [Candidatus Angelobacter sp.]|nr:hypothetical protein [Candidatus Angelobacter sp.]
MRRQTVLGKQVLVAALLLSLLSLPAVAQGPVPLGELFASDAGQKSLQPVGSGMTVVSGSELAAGIAPATLKLYRGGQVRICPRSGLSVSASGRGLMLATGTGAVEVDYQLSPEAVDVVITPDFNVTLVGPGTFHFAVEINKRGDTCVKPLEGNNSEITFSELLGTGSYKVKPDEAAYFPGGKIQGSTVFTGDCGCPPMAPVLRAENQPAAAPPKEKEKEEPNPPKPAEHVVVASNDPTAPTPPEHPGQVHVQVDTPFVFNARPSGTGPYSVAKLQISTLPNVFFVQEQVDPLVLKEKTPEVSQKTEPEPAKPVEKPKQEKKGFMGRIKGFFGSLFHR